MGRPRVHDEATRAALLESAERILAEQGPEALSVRSVAEGADTTVQAIYSVFGDKDGLLRALYAEAFRLLGARVATVTSTDDPAADLVRIALDAFRPWALEHPSFYRLAFEQLVQGVDPGSEAQLAASTTFDVLCRYVERLLGTADRARDVAMQFHAMCQGLASAELQGFINDADSSADNVWRDGIAALVSGAAPRT